MLLAIVLEVQQLRQLPQYLPHKHAHHTALQGATQATRPNASSARTPSFGFLGNAPLDRRARMVLALQRQQLQQAQQRQHAGMSAQQARAGATRAMQTRFSSDWRTGATYTGMIGFHALLGRHARTAHALQRQLYLFQETHLK